MYEMTGSTIFASILITWGIGLLPPVLIRYAILKRPIGKLPAVVICMLFWVANLVIFSILGSQSKTHTALALVAMVSYWILGKGRKPSESEKSIASSKEEDLSKLMICAANGDLEGIRKLVNDGEDINAKSKSGTTALMYAARNNHLAAVEFLVTSGADPMLKSEKHSTAIDIAKRFGYTEIATFLERHPGNELKTDQKSTN